jgi:spore germination protein YaaH
VLLLVVLLVASACISVTQQPDPNATPSPSPLASVATPSPSPTPPPSPTPEPTPAPTPAATPDEVIGFLPAWLIDQAIETLDREALTVLALHGIEASGDGRLVARKPSGDVPDGWAGLGSDAFATLKSDLQGAGVRVVPVIQRFGWSEGTLERTRQLLTSKTARRDLATRIGNLVEERGFDGVNLDVEPVPDDLADEFATLVREVRRELDEVKPGLQLSVDVVPGMAGDDLAALTDEGAADLVVLMGYNYRTQDAQVAGSTDPLHDERTGDLATTVEEALAQAPGDRLVLALPWYGFAWSTETDEAGARTLDGEEVEGPVSVPYADAVDLAATGGLRFDAEQASAWTAYPSRSCDDCPVTWRQAWFDDPDSFDAKIDLALGEGFAGVGIWALGYDAGHGELWWPLRRRVDATVDAAAPNGTATLDPDSLRGDLEGLDVVQGSASLRLFASDGDGGSGLYLVRLGLDDALDEDGQLVLGRSYPAVERIEFPLGDEETGGSPESGPRSVHVQWRDVAGNWSAPIVLEVHVLEPATSATPESLAAPAMSPEA